MNSVSAGVGDPHPGDDIRISRLDGGLRVVTEAIPSARSAAIGVWVGVGNRDEPASLAGVSHFLEHLLFKGSSTRSARDIAETVDAVGGDLNAFTSKEYTAFHARVPATQFTVGLSVLLDVVSDPGFTAADVDAERQVILEELAWSNDTPDDVVHGTLAEALFPSHPLGWEVLGTEATVSTVTADDVREFHDRWYRRANLVVAVAGPVDHDTVVAEVDRVLAGLAPGVRPDREPPGSATGPGDRLVRPIEQAHVAMGWRAPHQTHPDRFASAVASQVLGGGWSSRLFQEIRERRGMSYSVYSSLSAYHDAGTLTLYAATSPERVAELCEVVDKILEDLVVRGPGERELEVARGGFEGATVLGLEDPGGRMARLATNVLQRDRVIGVDEFLDSVRAVTADDVQRVLGEVVGAPRVLATVGPDGSVTPRAVGA